MTNDGDNGTVIEGATVVVEGSDLSATTDAYGYYLLENVPAGGQEVTASADGYRSHTATVTVVESDTVTQGFTLEAIPTYTITATAGAGGAIDPSGDVVVSEGADQTFTITPDTGHEISDVVVDGESVGVVASYTFVNVTAGHTIHATFAEATVTEPTKVTVDAVRYSTIGGGRHLRITIVLVDDFGAPVSGAQVSIEVYRGADVYATSTGTTNGDGEATFGYNHAPSGTYTTKVTDVVAGELEWDGVTPGNSFTK